MFPGEKSTDFLKLGSPMEFLGAFQLRLDQLISWLEGKNFAEVRNSLLELQSL